MEADIQIIISAIKDTYGAVAGGALAAISVAVYGMIKVLRLQLVQAVLAKISPKLAWSSWPKWAAALFVFVATTAAALLAALSAGTAWLPAIIGSLSLGIPAALGAMGIDATVGAVTTPKPGGAANP